jgi:hypothetical protein
VRSHEKHGRFDHNLFKKRRRSAVGRIISTEALRGGSQSIPRSENPTIHRAVSKWQRHELSAWRHASMAVVIRRRDVNVADTSGF